MLTALHQQWRNLCRPRGETRRNSNLGAAQAVQPFGNILQVVEITGGPNLQSFGSTISDEKVFLLLANGRTGTPIRTSRCNGRKPVG